MKHFPRYHRPRGFTLIELSIAVVVLTMLAIFSGQIYLNYTAASRNLKGANLVYEEARFLMEKIVREVRQNGIDYEQYFNQNVMIPLNVIVLGETENYTDNYCSYSSFFFDNNNESRGTRNVDRENIITTNLPPLPAPLSPASAVRPIEKELYLINISGNTRTVLTRVTENVSGKTIGKVALLKLVGKDFGSDHINGLNPSQSIPPVSNPTCKADEGENDGLIDSWQCDAGFKCKANPATPSTSPSLPGCQGLTQTAIKDPADPDYSFVDISPNALNIVDLKFMIAPADDPWKAYKMNDVQIQPHVTIQMIVEANPLLVAASAKTPPSITLTTTITARNYDEINSDCRK